MRLFCLALLLLLYLALAFYQLGLPGLHYDEAREAGLNAMQILTGAPVTAFRESGLSWGGRTFPLMVQDYIGALNVYLSLPMLALIGIGVPNLRVLPILCGLLTLLLLERAVSTWVVWHDSQEGRPIPVTLEGLVAVALVAGSPSFVFWSRQGIFVTNLTQVWVALMLWQGICWLRSGEARPLRWAALAAGLALYAKLLAVWVVAPLGLLLLWGRLASSQSTVRQLGRALPGALAAFLFPLLPLFWFNLQSGGTLAALGDNLTHSYYGVDNLAVGVNLIARLAQFVQVLRGDQFWYLGTVLANPVAPWVALVVAGAGAWRAPRLVLPALLLLALAVLASVFTVSDLFVTHYALLQPLVLATVGLAGGHLLAGRSGWGRPLVATLLAASLAVDLTHSVGYHRALAASGGLASHSDASYPLAYHLRYNGMGAPIALDWGIDAPVRYLTAGSVTPIEIFGYASPSAPDAGFNERLRPFLDNPDNVYLLHSAAATVFQGRADHFFAMARAQGRTPVLERRFVQRDGTPLYEIWKVYP